MPEDSDKYSFDSEYLFSNYYSLWVRNNIQRHIDSAYFFTDMPTHVVEKLLPIIDANRELFPLFEETESNEYKAAIISKCNLSEKDYEQLIILLSPMESFENTPECFNIIDDISPEIDEELITQDLDNHIINLFNSLTYRQELVIKMRTGFYDGNAKTLEEIGEIIGVTRERIRQIEAKALHRLKHPNRSKQLKDFYY